MRRCSYPWGVGGVSLSFGGGSSYGGPMQAGEHDVLVMTERGNAELRGGGTSLPPEHLHTLILVDGRSTVAQIVKRDRKSTRLNSSHSQISYAVFCLKKKKKKSNSARQTQRNDYAHITHTTPHHHH